MSLPPPKPPTKSLRHARRRLSRRRLTHRFARLGLLWLLIVGAAVLTSARAEASVTVGSPEQLVGGLSDVQIGGLAVARDGTGGIVYTASTAGISHVYFSRLLNGAFSPPQQLDVGGLSGAGQPVITADDGGQLLLAFVSGGALYSEETTSAGSPLSAPQLMATGASNPSISMNLFGVGYLAYTASDGSGDDVDVDYWNGSSWAPASPQAMNNTLADNAGTGTGAPSVVAASDGVGIVAWGEGGHIYSRRVWGTGTSTEIEQDDPSSYAGLDEVSSGDVQVATGGDSTYPDIVFSETFSDGPTDMTRAMLTRLVAEDTEPAVAIDGLGGPGQNALDPQVAMGEVGRGIITADTGTPSSASTTPTTTSTTPTTTPTSTTTTPTGTTTTSTAPTTTSPSGGPGPTATIPTGTSAAGATTSAVVGPPFGVEATILGENGTAGTPGSQASGDGQFPEAAAGVFGQTSSGLAWDQVAGSISNVEVGYAADGIDIAAPFVVSTPADGPIQDADGLMLTGDGRGDAAAAWVQGSGNGALSIYTAQMYTPESAPGLDPPTVDARTSTPTLAWTGSAEDWGGVNYTVLLNGSAISTTTADSLQLTNGLTDGTYSWSLIAVNAVGDQVGSGTGKVVVDTYAPRLRLRLTGAPRVRALQRLTLSYQDVPNPAEAGARASGIKSVTVNWGDARASTITHRLTLNHLYAGPGVYTVTVTVSDQVGNLTTLRRMVRVLP